MRPLVPVVPAGGVHTPHVRKRPFLPEGHRGMGWQRWVAEGQQEGQEGTYIEKLVMKAFLGSSIWKTASCILSALLTTLLVTTVCANRDETLQSTVRL